MGRKQKQRYRTRYKPGHVKGSELSRTEALQECAIMGAVVQREHEVFWSDQGFLDSEQARFPDFS